jgi:hypothetical protein
MFFVTAIFFRIFALPSSDLPEIYNILISLGVSFVITCTYFFGDVIKEIKRNRK